MEAVTLAEDGLWQGIRKGDQSAFRQLYNQYAEMLYSYGMKYIRDDEEVKDCIHDLFIDIYTYRKTLSPDVNIKFYLMRSLKRKLTASLKKSSATASKSAAYLLLHPDEFTITFSTEDVIIAREQQQESMKLLVREMNLLPARQKEILFLRFNTELQYEEVASIMEISVATCRTLVYRAIKQLREKLEGSSAGLIALFLLINRPGRNLR